jgi:Transcription factor WhiB
VLSHDDEPLCRQTDPEIFFPEQDKEFKINKKNVEKKIEILMVAIRLCNECPIPQKCLDYAMSTPETIEYGIWGGTLSSERRSAIGVYARPVEKEMERLLRVVSRREGIETPVIPPVERTRRYLPNELKRR